MGTQGSRTARALIVVGCIWLVVGAVGVLLFVGPRLYLDASPQPEGEAVGIARLVLEPVTDVLMPLLFVAVVLGAAVQTLKLLLSLLRRRA